MCCIAVEGRGRARGGPVLDIGHVLGDCRSGPLSPGKTLDSHKMPRDTVKIPGQIPRWTLPSWKLLRKIDVFALFLSLK